jgi:uncharacterized membrane protein
MKNRNAIRAVLAIGVTVSLQAHAATYSIKQLGTLDGTNSAANAINDQGQVVGVSDNSAVVWNGSTPTRLAGLPPFGQQGSYATGINDAGQISGVNSSNAATVWSGNTLTTLGALQGPGSFAWGINSAGQVAGMSDPGQAVVWNNSTTSILSPGGGKAYAINDAGTVAGCLCSPDQYDSQAVVWSDGSVIVLGGQWGSSNGSAALAINDLGQVAGYGNYHASQVPVVWNGTTPTILPTLSGLPSKAKAINDAGEIVGFSAGHAVLWSGGSLTDLNQFLGAQDKAAGWILRTANDINEFGVIVGTEFNSVTGVTRAFELTPVPEPGSFGLALAGLGLLGLVARRRRGRAE